MTKNRNLNGSDILFERDQYISFEEESHRYSVAGYGEMRPVSSIIAHFFKEFDALYWSLRKCNNNPAEAEKLRDEWASKGCLATQVGTFLHKQIEDYLNGKQEIEMLCNTYYQSKYMLRNEPIDISREWSYFLDFHNNYFTPTHIQEHDTPFRTEWRVFDTDAHMAGTIDLVCARPDGTYSIYDWKRSNKIDPNEYNRFASGINGLEHLTDTAYSHYCLQQNLYRYMLERNYGISISSMNLVVLHPTLSTYRVVPVPRMDSEIAIILNRI